MDHFEKSRLKLSEGKLLFSIWMAMESHRIYRPKRWADSINDTKQVQFGEKKWTLSYLFNGLELEILDC